MRSFIETHPDIEAEVMKGIGRGFPLKTILRQMGIENKYDSVYKYLHKQGVVLPKGRKNVPVKDYSKFAKFLFEWGGKPLPREKKMLSQLSGCSETLIHSYFQRKGKKIRRGIKKWLEENKNGAFIDREGKIIPIKAIKKYEISFDHSYTKPYLCLYLYGGGLAFSIFDEQHRRKA